MISHKTQRYIKCMLQQFQKTIRISVQLHMERKITVFVNSEHIVVPLQLFMYSLTECDNTGITVVYIYNSRILLLQGPKNATSEITSSSLLTS